LKLVPVLAQSRRMQHPTSIRALFSLPGFVAASRLLGVFGAVVDGVGLCYLDSLVSRIVAIA